MGCCCCLHKELTRQDQTIIEEKLTWPRLINLQRRKTSHRRWFKSILYPGHHQMSVWGPQFPRELEEMQPRRPILHNLQFGKKKHEHFTVSNLIGKFNWRQLLYLFLFSALWGTNIPLLCSPLSWKLTTLLSWPRANLKINET